MGPSAEVSSGPLSSPTSTTTVKSKGKPVIAVDVDEVLGHFVSQLCKFHNESYGTELSPDSFTSYQFHEVWGGSREEADKKVSEFFASPHFLEGEQGHGIPAVEGAVEVLRKHAENFELHVVTSRQNILREMTEVWVAKHYPEIFTKLHFGNHYSHEGESRSKPDLCRDIDAVMIIDDNVRYAKQCADAGIRTCLFGNYAWNRSSEALPSNIHRTFSWDDVDKALLSVAAASAPAATAATSASTAAAPTQQREQAQPNGEVVSQERCTTQGDSAGTGENVTGAGDSDGAAEEGSAGAEDQGGSNEEGSGGGGGGGNEEGGASGGADGDDGGGSDDGDEYTPSGSVVVAVEVSKKVADIVEVAMEKLAKHETVCLRSLEKGHSLGVDAVQELERLDVATKTAIKTSLVELSSGSRTCVEITVRRTQRFAEQVAAEAAAAAAATKANS